MCVEFDKTKPSYPHPNSNDFVDTGYILGSVEITESFSEELRSLGAEQLRHFMKAIKGETGAEAVYGVLFEQYTHDLLRFENRKFNVRIVRQGGDSEFDPHITTEIPVEGGVVRFAGQEAKGITEAAGSTKYPLGTYFLPESSTFPTYDAAVVVPGEVLGEKGINVGLLLQMTVSGATGIRRKPKHSVKNYMRREMDAALKQTVTGIPKPKPMKSYTAFCVPSACFYPFVYQMEEQQDKTDTTVNQAGSQIVIEIPECMQLPVSKKPFEEIHGGGRIHRYVLRDTKRTKLGESSGDE